MKLGGSETAIGDPGSSVAGRIDSVVGFGTQKDSLESFLEALKFGFGERLCLIGFHKVIEIMATQDFRSENPWTRKVHQQL